MQMLFAQFIENTPLIFLIEWVLAEFEENYFSEHQALIFEMHMQYFPLRAR